MIATRSDCISVDEAVADITAELSPIRGVEHLPLGSALGRILAEDVLAPMDIPQHASSAMDGYAIQSGDIPSQGRQRLRIVGKALAGTPFDCAVCAGECVQIMTGALLPLGADTVLRQEDVERSGEEILIPANHRAGENVRRPGEDVSAGEAVVSAGHALHAADIGLLASFGVAEVSVHRRLRVAFFTTGDELCAPGAALSPGKIYDSNRLLLHAMITRLEMIPLDLGVVRDRPQELARALTEAAAGSDAVISTGGVSVGDADHVRTAVGQVGRLRPWHVAIKPGHPFAFGRIGGAPYFGLPGNPVAVMVTFSQLARPALLRLAGAAPIAPLRLRVPCVAPLRKKPGRREYQRGVLRPDPDGRLVVESTGPQGAGILSSMSRANCYIVLPEAQGDVRAGDEVEVEPFAGLA